MGEGRPGRGFRPSRLVRRGRGENGDMVTSDRFRGIAPGSSVKVSTRNRNHVSYERCPDRHTRQ